MNTMLKAHAEILGKTVVGRRTKPSPAIGLPFPDTPVIDDVDHIQEIRNGFVGIEEEDETLTKLENRLDRLIEKLTDPELLNTYPAESSVRLEAEDKRDAIQQEIFDHRATLNRHIYAVANHGARVNEDDLEELGRELDLGGTVFTAVEHWAPGMLSHATWQVLKSQAVPF